MRAKILSVKEFMGEVKGQLKEASPEMLRGILLYWAEGTPPRDRRDFLARLRALPLDKNKKIPDLDSDILDEIEELEDRVESGDFSQGWGWDDAYQEERDWGDESWAKEVDDFFERARLALMAGRAEQARDAYRKLFDILDMGQEPGHLPGSPEPTDMLESDLDEATSCYLRAVYLSSPLNRRAENLLEAFQNFGYQVGEDLNLKSVMNAGPEPLPGFEDFLSSWIRVLHGLKAKPARFLLREAVVLSGGTKALAELARKEGKGHPSAYIDWIKLLEKEGAVREMADAAQEGLEKVPKDYALRADIAEGLARAGESLKDRNLKLVGFREAFYSRPSLEYYFGLVSLAEEMGLRDEEIKSALERLEIVVRKTKKSGGVYSPDELETVHPEASEVLLAQTQLLAGRWREAVQLCDGHRALGWTYGDNPKGIVLPFMLRLLSRGADSSKAGNLEKFFIEAVRYSCARESSEIVLQDRFSESAEKSLQVISLTEDERNSLTQWCLSETEQRVDAIVGELHRQSYDKAANLLWAMAEILAAAGQKREALALVDKYRKKYNRHRAFQAELDRAKKGSWL